MNGKIKKNLNSHEFFFKWIIYILYLIISLQIFFKELTKYKNDYQPYLNYIYMIYIMHLIVYL